MKCIDKDFSKKNLTLRQNISMRFFTSDAERRELLHRSSDLTTQFVITTAELWNGRKVKVGAKHETVRCGFLFSAIHLSVGVGK